jgi:hypothetical protein
MKLRNTGAIAAAKYLCSELRMPLIMAVSDIDIR